MLGGKFLGVPSLPVRLLCRCLNHPENLGDSGVSRVLGRRDSGFSCRCGWLISSFELDWCDHAKRGVPSLTMVEDLEVVEDGVRQLDSCAPTLPVEEFDLRPAPERLDEGIVVAVPDRTHRRQQPGIDRAASECP